MSEEHFFIPVSCGIGTGAVGAKSVQMPERKAGETVTTTAFGPGASLADVAASALSGHPWDQHAAP